MRVVQKIAAMPDDSHATALVNSTGLELFNVLWEDTGRWEGIVCRSEHQRRHD